MINAGVLVLGLPLALIVAIVGYQRHAQWGTILASISITVWALAVIAATLFPFPYQTALIELERQDQLLSNNFVPFATVWPAIAGGFHRPLAQVVANVAMFIPLGFLLPPTSTTSF